LEGTFTQAVKKSVFYEIMPICNLPLPYAPKPAQQSSLPPHNYRPPLQPLLLDCRPPALKDLGREDGLQDEFAAGGGTSTADKGVDVVHCGGEVELGYETGSICEAELEGCLWLGGVDGGFRRVGGGGRRGGDGDGLRSRRGFDAWNRTVPLTTNTKERG
jgi:hypothetical protein